MALGRKTGGKDWEKGAAPRSLGRPRDSLVVRKLKNYLRSYLEESGDAILDFEKLRRTDPGLALKFAADRLYGRPREAGGMSSYENDPMVLKSKFELELDEEKNRSCW